MIERFTRSLFSFLPPGLFSYSYSENLRKLLVGIAGEFSRASSYVKNSFDNIFPKNSDENFLLKWGAFTRQGGVTLDALRTNVIRQLRKRGGATRTSLEENVDFISGEQDPMIKNLSRFTCTSRCDEHTWGEDIVHSYEMTLPKDIEYYTCNSTCNSWIRQNQKEEVLQYIIGSSPAHSVPVFFYYE